MTDREWYEMVNKLLTLEDEKYWDATIQKLNALRADLKYLEIQRRPFKTKPFITTELHYDPTPCAQYVV